jgi:hypothetical protein
LKKFQNLPLEAHSHALNSDFLPFLEMKFALFLLAFHVPATLAETTYKIIDGCNNAGGICGSCTFSSPTQTSGTKYTWAGAASFPGSEFVVNCNCATNKWNISYTPYTGISGPYPNGECRQSSSNYQVTCDCGGGGGAAPSCFPSSALATQSDGSTIRLDALKEGDLILAAAIDGTLTTDTVSLLSLADREAKADFLSLITADNRTLTLTSTHHLPVGATCCSNLRKAKDVTVGETVWVANDKSTSPSRVIQVTSRADIGLHSPVLTKGSFPIINGFVTSFDRIEVATLASWGLPTLLSSCKVTGMCDLLRRVMIGAHEGK